MTIAAKHMDPVVGVDTHIILIPTPAGPVPTPLPHPHVGMVMDPIDYAPIIGATVYINGLPRAQAGTAGIMTPPHIPMGGPFAKPPSMESELFMGSATVVIDGEAQGYLGLPALSCQDIGMPAPPRMKGSPPKSLVLPTCVVLAIPMGPPVLIGGPPTISMMAIGMKVGGAALGKAFKKARALQKSSRKMKAISDKIHDAADKLMKKAGVGDAARNKAHKGICTVTGHPVDVATGKVFTDKTDLRLPGPLPFAWTRTWYSTSTYRGPLGHGWHHEYDAGLLLDAEGQALVYRTPDGRHVALPALKEGQEHFDRSERITLLCDMGGYGIRDAEGKLYRFRPLVRGRDEMQLTAVYDRAGNGIQLEYDAAGRLESIVDSGGRRLGLRYGSDGRIAELTAPHPEQAGERVTMARYVYDGRGNLAQVIDPLGFSERYEYERNLLRRETDKNGLSFHFEYDGKDETARCVRTWGDGGIYDHKLSYDVELGLTTVVDSLGHKTQYQHRGGVVIRTVDPLGATSLTEYNEHNQVVKETDALGNATVYAYDARGNTSEVLQPDGGKVAIEYDARDNPVQATDALGGQWTWRYDERGRLVERTDPLGRATKYQYRGSQLVAVIDPGGQATGLRYDDAGNVTGVFTPDGGGSEYRFDRLGRAVEAQNPGGAVQERAFDALGRVLRVHEPDGNVRELAYDAEGNVIHAKDQQHDVRFAYQGMGRLVARSEAGTTVRFRYDSEERLTAIENEHARVYRFELDPAGEVGVEQGFDGLRRDYHRDLLGRVTEVRRPGRLKSRYRYDPAGRVTAIEHSDGSAERYRYRADGELIEAENDAAKVTFERDGLGRIVKESCGRHWVANEYDPLGMRSRMQSSLGALQQIERNAMGDVTAVSGSFEARFERDLLGQELSRELPGGVRSRWQRDKLGRPVVHEVWSASGNHRAVRYQWDVDDRLSALIDAHKGPIRYGHDPLGNLAWAQYPDGSRELRMPDAVGNLFRREDRSDRKYGDAGQLLESTDAEGRVTRYEYDAEGNLARKLEPYGRVWRYHWNAAGMLARVDRPDGRRVWFNYDALGRRLSKTFRGKTTRWVWDGNNPLHEWVEDAAAELLDATWDEREEVRAEDANVLAMHPPTGPRGAELAFSGGGDDYLQDAATENEPITWLFEPESFAPMARLQGEKRESIVTDHLGTPVAMLDGAGALTWSAELDTYGAVRTLDNGEPGDCPFRFPGQYADAETGLYYNRFRYYDPGTGRYAARDRLGIRGGLSAYTYPYDVLVRYDPLGLIVVYRNLRPDEDPSAGLTAKKPGRGMSPGGHVRNGSKETFKGSQYISTTTDPAVAEAWRQEGQVTVKFDTEDVVPDAAGNRSIVDVSTPEKAKAAGLRGPSVGYASSSKEVLVEGRVPSSAIERVC